VGDSEPLASVQRYNYEAEGHTNSVGGGSTASYVYNALNQQVRTVVVGVPARFSVMIHERKTEIEARSKLTPFCPTNSAAERQTAQDGDYIALTD
jgi:hypothetical protein